MAANADAPCSWTTTPSSVIGCDNHSNGDFSDDPSTPDMVRELRWKVQYGKQIIEGRQMPQPDPALQTVRGFVVCPEAAAAASWAAAAVQSNHTVVPELGELALAYVKFFNHLNQRAMQQNRAIDAAAPPAAAPVAKETKHVQFAKLPPPPHHAQPKKEKVRSPPQAPPPPPGLIAETTPPEEVWTKTYRCTLRHCELCHRMCHGITVWCIGDKRYAPCMRGPNRQPNGKEGGDIVEFDMAALREDCATF
ncbi:hypothetical protein PG987_013568 [Apiospora arundinis]